MSDQMPPAMLADYDQRYAESERMLGDLLNGHRCNLEMTAAAGMPQAAAVYALTQFLMNEMRHELVVSALAVAVNRLAGQSA